MNIPEFKANFRYSNIGMVVGTLCYVKELKKQTGETYGHEFLINASGHGSVNVRIPMLAKSQQAMDNYPVSDKPKVRVGLASLGMFFAQNGKVYTTITSFAEMMDAVKVDGSEMPDSIKGRVGGEVADMRMNADGTVTVMLVTYDVDKEGKRIKLRNGNFIDPKVLKLEVVDQPLIEELKQKVRVGTNLEVGYSYVNKENHTYDEFGFPVGDGQRIERVEVKKIVVHGGNGGQRPMPQQQPPVQQQANPFAQQQQQQPMNDPFANPFGNAQTQTQNADPFGNDFGNIDFPFGN